MFFHSIRPYITTIACLPYYIILCCTDEEETIYIISRPWDHDHVCVHRSWQIHSIQCFSSEWLKLNAVVIMMNLYAISTFIDIHKLGCWMLIPPTPLKITTVLPKDCACAYFYLSSVDKSYSCGSDTDKCFWIILEVKTIGQMYNVFPISPHQQSFHRQHEI
jgi:hypothetical protein